MKAVLDWVWKQDSAAPPWARFLRYVARLFYVSVRELVDGKLSLHAMSLVYTTLLSLVPLLAVSFSVLKAFGVHNQVEPLLNTLLLPLGEKGAEITHTIITFVDNVKVGVLGAVGLALLIYTVVSVIQKIEDAFSFIWQIRRRRNFSQAFSSYVSIILVGPVLLFSALGFGAWVMSTSVVQSLLAIEPLGRTAFFAGRMMPLILIGAMFSFAYAFLPNTRVRFGAAVTGGFVAALLWQLTGQAFASFIVTSIRYEAIYSGFAILILFMIWLYLSWLILLLGAQIAFYHQHPQLLSRVAEGARPTHEQREYAGLAIMTVAGRRHYDGTVPVTLDDLTDALNIHAAHLVRETVDRLLAGRLLTETADDPPAYVPARALDRIALKEVLDAVRRNGKARLPAQGGFESVTGVLGELDAAAERTLHGRTVQDLVLPDADQASKTS